MKRILITGALCAMAFAASAQGVVSISESTDTDTAVDASARNHSASPFCLHGTGSLIATSQNAQARRRARAAKDSPELKCSGIGRSYSRDEISSTGAVDLADALQRLDPAVN